MTESDPDHAGGSTYVANELDILTAGGLHHNGLVAAQITHRSSGASTSLGLDGSIRRLELSVVRCSNVFSTVTRQANQLIKDSTCTPSH